ncbi:MAG: hypothetical protein H8D97_00470 [Proteobacteria bacterium]|nr:hypothetical protein [Pseudomonadota bacterium]
MDTQNLIQEVKWGNLKYYNFYNTDLELSTYFTVKHYLENPNDDIDIYEQKIHTLYLDIEVFKDDPDAQFDFNKSDFPISAICDYSTIEKTFRLYFLIHPMLKGTFNSDPEWYRKQLLEKQYITEEEKVEVSVFQNELQLIEKCWEDIRKINPMVLSGFNSDRFDYVYIYRRLLGFYNGDENTVNDILSEFGNVKYDGNIIKIPEFGNADLQYFYKPRAECG